MSLVGTPPPVLLAARSHKLNYHEEVHTLTVPIRGESHDICPEEGVFLFGTLIETLFSAHKYPALEDNQMFILLGLEFDKETVSLVGRIADKVED